jgi:hypothetical protein
MARSMARQARVYGQGSTLVGGNPGEFEDSWPDEPTAVDAAMTMEELILDELRRQGGLPAAANDPKKGTHPR